MAFLPDKKDVHGPAKVVFATCQGCPAGEQGGLCQHIFALLMVVEHYRPPEDGNRALPGGEACTLICVHGVQKKDVSTVDH